MQANYQLQGYVRDMDIAPTAAWALGMQQNALWVGKPIIESWTGYPQVPVTPPQQITSNVVVLVISGLTTDGVEHAHTPILDQIINEGASTMKARAVIPATSDTNLASIFLGAGPEETGICIGSIDGVPCSWSAPPAPAAIPPISNPTQYFPSIFDVLNRTNQAFYSGALYNLPNATAAFNSSSITYQYRNSSDEDVALGASYFFTNHPNFTMIQFNEVQTAASSHGYNSSQYYSAIEDADKNIAIIYNSLLVSMPNSIV